PVYAPIFYDSNNNGYYVDPNGTSALNVLRFNTADCLNGSCPANGAIRYTPNFHLNAPNGYAVIINWDNGSTPGANVQQLRVGNGQAADAFYVTSAGYAFGSYVNTTDNSVGSGVTGVMVKQGDNYHRTANAAAVAAFVAKAFPNGIDFDTSNADDGTFGVNQLLFGAPGTGEGIGSKRTAGGNQFGLDFYTNFTQRMFLTQAGVLQMAGGALCNGTTWINASDRNLKTAFASISPAQVLQNLLSLPVQSWQYKSDSAGSRHIGPVAQDFHAAFAVGDDDRHISTVDEGGVALVAIQGLNQKLEEQLQKKDAQIAALQKERDAQQGQLAAVQEQMNAMMQRLKTVEKSVAGSRTQDKLLATKQ
ncbi:MAG TPA: tail fiber domain-containing protein, partial [Terriglobales bacterium]|nr:tail fiber domain-containing protein [Terriglobales bacterium]